MTVEQRRQLVRDKNLCMVCFLGFDKNHVRGSCTIFCDLCNPRYSTKHHTMVHVTKSDAASVHIPNVQGSATVPKTVHVHPKRSFSQVAAKSTTNAEKTRASLADKTVLLQSCEAEVQMPSGKLIQARVFIDGGSQKSFVTKDFVRRAGLRPYGSQRLSIGSFGFKNWDPEREYQTVLVDIITTEGWTKKLCCLVMDHEFCAPMDSVEVEVKQVWPYLKNLKLADHYPSGEKKVDILVGLDYEKDIMLMNVVRGGKDQPVARQTLLGWILCGPYVAEGKTVTKQGVQNVSVNWCRAAQSCAHCAHVRVHGAFPAYTELSLAFPA
jgi:hypothetical protein